MKTSPRGKHQAPGETEQGDLRIVARNKKISADEANLRYGWQEEFTQIVAKLAERYPDKFADAAMPGPGAINATVTFVGAPPQEAALLLQNLPVPVEIFGSALTSARDLQADVAAVADTARQALGGNVQVEPGGAGILVTTDRATAARSTAPPESVVKGALSSGRVPKDRVTVKVVEKLTGYPAVVVYGGGALSSCTSGFTVRRTSGTQKGIITADHCPNSQNYEGKPVLTYRSRLLTSQGDMQYMSSSDSVGYSFYNDRGRLSSQDRVGTPVRNMAICWFGKTTNVKKCTEVNNYPIAVGAANGNYANLVNVDGWNTQKGDSGGPWSYGTTVYGITHGVYYARDVFTPLYNTLSRLGITINY